MIYKAQTSAYKYSWMLIPLSVPFVWLLFPFSRRFRGYDHTVFVTYSLAFMTLGFVALSLLRPLGLPASATQWAIALIPPLRVDAPMGRRRRRARRDDRRARNARGSGTVARSAVGARVPHDG